MAATPDGDPYAAAEEDVYAEEDAYAEDPYSTTYGDDAYQLLVAQPALGSGAAPTKAAPSPAAPASMSHATHGTAAPPCHQLPAPFPAAAPPYEAEPSPYGDDVTQQLGQQAALSGTPPAPPSMSPTVIPATAPLTPSLLSPAALAPPAAAAPVPVQAPCEPPPLPPDDDDLDDPYAAATPPDYDAVAADAYGQQEQQHAAADAYSPAGEGSDAYDAYYEPDAVADQGKAMFPPPVSPPPVDARFIAPPPPLPPSPVDSSFIAPPPAVDIAPPPVATPPLPKSPSPPVFNEATLPTSGDCRNRRLSLNGPLGDYQAKRMSLTGSFAISPVAMLPVSTGAVALRISFLTGADKNLASCQTIRFDPESTLNVVRQTTCLRNRETDPSTFVVALTEGDLVCPLDVTVADLNFAPLTVKPLLTMAEEGDEHIVRSDVVVKTAGTEALLLGSQETFVTIIGTDATCERRAITLPVERTPAQLVEEAARELSLPGTPAGYTLGIPEIGLCLNGAYATRPLRLIPFVQACNMTGISPTFEIFDASAALTVKALDPDAAAELIRHELSLFKMIGGSYMLTISSGKDEVADARRVLAKMRTCGEFHDEHSEYHARALENNFVYTGSEPSLADPAAKLLFSCTFPGMENVKNVKMQCTGETTVADLTRQIFNKLSILYAPATEGKMPDDFIVKAHGLNEYLVPVDESGKEYTIGMFDCVRRSVLKNEFIQFSFLPRSQPITPPAGQLDGITILDKILARDKVEMRQMKTLPMTLNRQFKVRVHAAFNVKFPSESDSGKFTPPPRLAYVTASLYHGGVLLDAPVFTPVAEFDLQRPYLFRGWGGWLCFQLCLCHMPKEARICLTLYGTSEPAGTLPKRVDPKDVPLGWCAKLLVNHRSQMIAGTHTVKLWDGAANSIGTCEENTIGSNRTTTTLLISFEEFRFPVCFTDVSALYAASRLRRRSSVIEEGKISASDAHKLSTILGRDPLQPMDQSERSLVWRSRELLHSKPRALPMFLRSINYNNPDMIAEAHRLLEIWPQVQPTQALELLDAKFADEHVRKFAVNCLSTLSDTEISQYLLQLTQVLKYERSHDNDLAKFLLKRALRNKNHVGHMFYWYLKAEMHVETICERYGILLEAFLRGCSGYRAEVAKQNALLCELESIARELKVTPKEERLGMVRGRLAKIPFPEPVQLPIDPRFVVTGLLVEKCKFMDSKKLPLWLVFRNVEANARPIYIIFKEGDDLRQDILTLQMIRLMDGFWKQCNMDFRLQPYRCVATGDGIGMIEVVLDATTDANINKNAGGLKAIISDNTIKEWIKSQNPSEAEWGVALENFTLSCAGYCVATYILGIGDRHADNVMFTNKGHFFHIDFGHFLGNVKYKLGVKRERAPFKFTTQYAYILGGKDSQQFKLFEEKACDAYNTLRRQTDLFITLFSLMLSTGIPELQSESDIQYLRDALCVGKDSVYAANWFRQLIKEALADRSQMLNDLAHGWAHR
eukprot:TRINITY_DN1698_c1_g3_i1.p1 TRINITY_DN1698_c1_g3~~TRINITY_DN1698_c1_g3_i1.p1  ORF type:complete len:1497 (-),score=373.96 TRINITY_DN1698_c1_g3_i1:47-4501(-)